MKFDFIILGAGSAGSVLANRIATSGKGYTVALIEAGAADFGKLTSWQIQMPAALTYSIASDRYNWDFHSIPQRYMNNRVLHAPRGRVLGGSSSINAMVYARGHKEDFDRWEKEENAPGWGYDNVLPYFKRAQNHINNSISPFQGNSGPLKTKSYPFGQRNNTLYDVFEMAGVELGYPQSKELNGYTQEGFGSFDMTVEADTGVRCSASRAYLRPLIQQSHPKLTIFTKTMANKINFTYNMNNIPVAKGVTCTNIETGEVNTLEANKEVIVSLGAVGSPQLLQISGIGDANHLESIGVSSVVNNSWVGSNLQDHLEIYLQYLCKPEARVSIYPIADWDLSSPVNLIKRCFVGAQWFLTGKGICASNLFESGAFIRSSKDKVHPDIQYHFIPAIIHGQLSVVKQHGFQIHAGTLRPQSKGSIRAISTEVETSPEIDPNYLSEEQDIIDMRAAVRLGNNISCTMSFENVLEERYGDFKDLDLMDDANLDDWIRDNAESAYHLSCTCAIGKVVNENGEVYNTKGLRVVDASIMPSMTSGNLNAPTIMMAEKIADKILRNQELEPIKLNIFNKFYET